MDKATYERGLKIRKEVLGEAHVERSLATADEFSRPIQEFVTEFCWAEVWGRDGVDRRTRSVLNIGMLVALNRPHELKVHIRGALTNGLTVEEIGELLLQTMVYCGAPAALDAVRIAKEAIAEVRNEARANGG